jgi:hypothetical protein
MDGRKRKIAYSSLIENIFDIHILEDSKGNWWIKLKNVSVENRL